MSLDEMLRSALRSGQPILLSGGDESAGRLTEERTTVDGDVLLRVLTEPLAEGDRRAGLRLVGAVVSGPLDWSWREIDCPLEFEDCVFEDVWVLSNTRLRSLALVGCRVAELSARQLVVDGAVTFDRSSFSATVWLPDARVGGNLWITATRIDADDDWFGWRAAIVAPRIQVAGVARIDGGTRVRGGVFLRGARFGDGVIVEHARVGEWRAVAIDLAGARVSGDVVLAKGLIADGLVRLLGAVVEGSVICSGGQFRCPGGDSLSLDGARVSGSVLLRDGFCSVGRFRCIGAEIGGNFECDGGHFHNPRGQDAIWANSLTVRGNLFLRNGCHVNGQIRLVGAHIGRSVDLYGAVLTRPEGFAFAARNCTIGGDLQAARADISGWVHLFGATINGQLDFSGSRIRRTAGRPAITLTGAVVSGSVVFGRGGTYRGVPPPALPPSSVVIGRIEAGNCRIGGELFMEDLLLTGSTPRRHAGQDVRRFALQGRGMTVAGAVTIAGSSVVQGCVDLSGADLGAMHVHTGTVLLSSGNDAVRLSSAEIRSGLVIGAGVSVRGTLRLTAARVRGNFTLRETDWRDPRARSSISAQALVVDGETELQKVRLHNGMLGLRGATLQGRVTLDRARLRVTSGRAVDLHQARIAGELVLTRVRVVGCLDLSRAVVSGRLSVASARLGHVRGTDDPEGFSLVLDGAQALGGADRRWKRITGSVSADGFTTTVLADDPDAWPAGSVLTGATYERFASQATGRAALAPRLRWLERMPAYDPGPYEQLARVLRAHGLVADGERVLIAAQRQSLAAERRAVTGDSSGWRRARLHARRALGELVGYGYRPARALVVLAGLVLAVTGLMLLPAEQGLMRADDGNGTVYGVSGPRAPTPTRSAPDGSGGTVQPTASNPPAVAARCGDGAVPCFDPLYFAVDTVVPLVDLKQRAAWHPEASGSAGRILLAVLNLTTLLGWFLSSVFVVAFTKVVRTGA